MVKLIILISVLWIVLFILRVSQTGLDPYYIEPNLKPLNGLQQNLATTIEKLWPSPQSALMAGMLIGEGKKIPYFFKQDLITTSTIHIVVVSGQNLSILAGFLINLAYFLGRKKTICLTLGVLIFYSVLTGGQPPVIRAAIMAGVTFLGQLLGKQVLGWWGLMFTAAVMLLINPNYLYSVSFQLSFAATFGVAIVAPSLIKQLTFLPKLLKEDIGVSLAAQLMTLPIIAIYFGRISLAGILVNGMVLWTVTPVMIVGFLALFLGSIWTTLGQVVGILPGVLLTYFVDVVRLFAKVPGASINIGQTSMFTWVGYYLILAALWWAIRIHIKQQTLNKQ